MSQSYVIRVSASVQETVNAKDKRTKTFDQAAKAYHEARSVLPALWAMKRWLNNFAFKTPIPPWIFLAAGLIALVIAFITISYHSIRLANKNPAETLHYE